MLVSGRDSHHQPRKTQPGLAAAESSIFTVRFVRGVVLAVLAG